MNNDGNGQCGGSGHGNNELKGLELEELVLGLFLVTSELCDLGEVMRLDIDSVSSSLN